MPGLVPGIHVLCAARKYVDGRDKPGHDALEASVHPTITSGARCGEGVQTGDKVNRGLARG
ncbi:hypothetical protein EDE08_104425 [Bradyrhizobium sp. R2.2-H]|jgi:hypothetical protein|nr:hypothetical protein EDE10_104217 [Bradyrhizobium sp. Y-H1]TCU76259.1 hypothetical protein EDE08_104425 [Bradyrhizobium sp. R2.2-H]